jgi:TolB-like protein
MNRFFTVGLVACLAAGWLLSGCAEGRKKRFTVWKEEGPPFYTRPAALAIKEGFTPHKEQKRQASLTIQTVRSLADRLAERFPVSTDNPQKLVVMRFMETGNPDSADTFGRFAADQMEMRLRSLGFRVLEFHPPTPMKEKTETPSPDRDPMMSLPEGDIFGVVVGNYTVSGERVEVSAKILRVGTSEVLAKSSVFLDLTYNPFLVGMLETEFHLAPLSVAGKVYPTDPSSVVLQKNLELLAKQIDVQIKERQLGNTLIVTTFVDLDKLYRTSALGRYVSQQLMGVLHGWNYRVIDVRKSMGLLIEPGAGEFTLSRDTEVLFSQYTVDVILAGTYSRAGNRIVFNAHLLRAGGNEVVSVGRIDIEVPETDTFIQELADREVTFVSNFDASEER